MRYYEFHVSKEARKKYGFDKNLFALSGDLIIADSKQARLLTENINNIRKKEGREEAQVTAGQLNALGLLHEIYHHIISYYEENENKGVFSKSLSYLNQHVGSKELNDVLTEYCNEFPPQKVYKGIQSTEDFLEDTTYAKPNREIMMEELLILYLENNNPAAARFEDLYSDKQLSDKVKYIEVIDSAEQFFIGEKPIGSENLPLLQFLRKPILASPYSIEGQLDFILQNWGVYVYDKFNRRILSSKDLIYEDAKLFIHHGGGEKGTPPVPDYLWEKDYLARIKSKIAAGMALTKEEADFYYAEPERFTEDTDWMPQVIMLAKNAYVWLDQLSKKYGRSITTLNEIPDAELDQLARWNITALWLIGLWERSSASKKIKQFTGNPEAAASAYSLYDYIIASDLGGEEAFENLKHRAWLRGIRMASDMVPNHTGIYSKWVTEKPHYFIQRNDPPYPGYSFHGPNLSDDQRVEVRIEDKYYSREDAAVVFQRRDAHTGDIKYIYHGNDGTNMPWNDTAQLDLLNPEVRESLIQTIMHVARKTPIIRFDAAMTLAKKHFQRLWFPHPGTGGAIPSRSDFAMTREEFDRAMPEEFWREVVDRMNSEMPQTLLLAEAFWLMEGYFVRTLGMHRVYNSAFMHMMMKEENSKFRELIKNTLDFNPEILKRYVNFMSNPDEETAVNQFGKGDKYFGVALMMITLPGLPMIGHGQIEGFSEKYGMEYKKAYYDEFIDDNLVKRHEEEIFPLLRKRWLFSQVYNFELFDFIDDFGNLNENVFAFSNRMGGERSLIIYNNSYAEAKGTLRHSVNKVRGNNNISGTSLAEALDINSRGDYYYILFDHRSKLEYLYNGSEIHNGGVYFWLQGYEYRALIEFREVHDTTGEFYKLHKFLHGQGVPSVMYSLKELNLIGVHREIEQLTAAHNFGLIKKFLFDGKPSIVQSGRRKSYEQHEIPQDVQNNLNSLMYEINFIFKPPVDSIEVMKTIKRQFNSIGLLYFHLNKIPKKNIVNNEITHRLKEIPVNDLYIKALLLAVFGMSLVDTYSKSGGSRSELFDKLLLNKAILNALTFNDGVDVRAVSELIKTLMLTDIADKSESLFDSSTTAKLNKNGTALLTTLFENKQSAAYLNLNRHEGIEYFGKENFIELIKWLFVIYVYNRTDKYYYTVETKKKQPPAPVDNLERLTSDINNAAKFASVLIQKAEDSGYKTGDIIKSFMPKVKAPAKKKKSVVTKPVKPAGGRKKKQ